MTFFSLKRNWILGGYRSEYQTEGKLAPGSLPDLVDGFLRDVFSKLPVTGESAALFDVKGRNPQDILITGPGIPEKDEVFRLTGECGVADDENGLELTPFDVCCYTPFLRFEGNHHIVHSTEIQRHGAVPSWLPVSALGRAAPIRPASFRFGIEHFTSTMVFASLGYSPTVTESFLIDCVGGSIALKLTVETRSRSAQDPFDRLSYLGTAARVIEACCNLKFREDFTNRLQARHSH